ncbi:methylthioribose-1-phosphate isomerase [Synechococcus sp. PCC 7335]|uniref:S-methyl-5-thioribose-1-phosphate isomerase n=1 Tax=Synechococcus sp. (strain ATCC 29403 / PCC 7335) TaxID=91464 RepID=UPI00017EC371|nr:S-methyl-5-thioribose-1-phosphate isomerase [Synechococcus sp. PCC 7335]EDX85408.1 methylthioribose-1-phosphate isomerase [Synechococcus sp. PCC 7335]
MSALRSIEWKDDQLRLLDQRKLPAQTVYESYSDYRSVAKAIQTMVVRGAPAIGVTAAFGVAIAARQFQLSSTESFLADLHSAGQYLIQARPTAVNLAWAVNQLLAIATTQANQGSSPANIAANLLKEAQLLYQADIAACKQLGTYAQALIPNPVRVIHHCNTGSLAAVDYGTALGVIRIAHEQGKQIHVFLDETRPRLQGASLSAYEMKAAGISHTVIVDGASGYVMSTQKIDACIVGCDRVAANGDVANKIGTYNLALIAHAHQVPFYVACPTSTLDLSLASGAIINIEERVSTEITHINAQQITPDDTPVFNPAFDITPSKYITALITEKGIVYPPFEENLAKLMGNPSKISDVVHSP